MTFRILRNFRSALTRWGRRSVGLPLLAAALSIVGALGTASAAEGEERVTFIQYHLVASWVKADSFEGAPRKLWRYKDHHLRYEEPRNPANGSEILLIANAPDAWLINRTTRTGNHMVDPGPTFNVLFPVFQGGAPASLQRLQMGREVEFFQTRNAEVLADEAIDGVACKVMKLELGDTAATLWIDRSTSLPRQVSMRNPKVEYAVRYDVYRVDGALDMALFAKPTDVEISKGK